MKKQLLLFAIFSLLLLSNSVAQTVYITKSGKKYHTENCRYTNKNSSAIDLSDAISKGYTACKVCKPSSTESVTPSDSKTESIEKGNSKTSVDSQQSVQCSAQTKKGARCKRMTKSPNGKCWQHGGD